MFQQPSAFDPSRDGKVPLSRSPVALMLRLVGLVFALAFSRHPSDLLRWSRSMWHRRRPMQYALPWLTFDAIRALEREIRPGLRVFEFGSGHSTLFWAERGVDIASVEDDPNWYQLVQARIRAWPSATIALARDEASYIASISAANGPFDVVVVDGNFRKACITAALVHVKHGGLLVVDNTDWHWYDDIETMVPSHWQRTIYPGWAPFIGHRSETSMWRRPGAERVSAPG